MAGPRCRKSFGAAFREFRSCFDKNTVDRAVFARFVCIFINNPSRVVFWEAASCRTHCIFAQLVGEYLCTHHRVLRKIISISICSSCFHSTDSLDFDAWNQDCTQVQPTSMIKLFFEIDTASARVATNTGFRFGPSVSSLVRKNSGTSTRTSIRSVALSLVSNHCSSRANRGYFPV